MECFVYNWRILLGGAASAAILAVGVAAPAFAQAQDAPVSLSGLNSTSGVLCGLGTLPVSGEVAAAANVIGASCGTSSSTSSSSTSNMIQANGPMQAASALPGLNSVSGSIPALGNAASAAPGVANTSGTLGGNSGSSTSSATPGFSAEPGSSTSSTSGSGTGSNTGLGSVTGTVSGVTGGLQNGGSIGTPLSGLNG
jgi:hypothetical protein